MLVGRFGSTSGRPYIEGRLIFPRLEATADISFLVDTGADKTLIMPADGMRLGLDYSGLTDREITMGVGGEAETFFEDAWLIFAGDDNRLVAYERRIGVARIEPALLHAPSLLGRDIIDHWRVTYDKSVPLLVFDVLDADATIPVEP